MINATVQAKLDNKLCFQNYPKAQFFIFYSNHTVLQPYNLSMVNSSIKILSSNKLSI
jgi:hypothetical protein